MTTVTAMRALRLLCAMIFLVAITWAAPMHGATGHRSAGQTSMASHPGHEHGAPAKPDRAAQCKMACAATVAVLQAPWLDVHADPARTVRFHPPRLTAARGGAPAPDPFPSKPVRIA